MSPSAGSRAPAGAAGTVAVAGGILVAEEEDARPKQAVIDQEQQLQQQVRVGSPAQ